MKRRIVNVLLAACLTAGIAVGSLPTAGMEVKAAGTAETVQQNLTIRESEINQLLVNDLTLPDTVDGLDGAAITYSVAEKDAEYVAIEGSVLKVKKRPKSNEPDYKFTLKATVSAGGETAEKEFPMIIRAGLAKDDYAGYVYVCFADWQVAPPESADNGFRDEQQIHFFLSEDGLNWTALNGCHPIFETGTDYTDLIEKYGETGLDYEIKQGTSLNYKIKEGTDITQTTTGDASVLFPFEGVDQGVRDPYLIRGCKADGSDSNKVWLLATDLNTMAEKYGGNRAKNVVGNWGTMTTNGYGSTSLFVYETEDWVHWTRRYIDVNKISSDDDVGACMAWAPEAIYNPEKDNYLVYWSARTTVDGRARDRLYCNETEDFVTFGPTKLYEQEPFFENWKPNGVKEADDGYGNIDTSQLWVAETKSDGTVNPYGTLFRLVKDETNNHIELKYSDTVLAPDYEGRDNQAAYDATDATRITEYTNSYGTFDSLEKLNQVMTPATDPTNIKRAEIVYHWLKDESVGDHFEPIKQEEMESYAGAYEGATLFKFIDRDEWCVMIDNYGNMSIRYEPYLTTDLSKDNSIKKAEEGTYGRTDGDVGTHGGMIPITVEEYNAMIDAYNADPEIDNYHEIKYAPLDTRIYSDKAQELAQAAKSQAYSAGVKAQMNSLSGQLQSAVQTIEDLQNPKPAQKSAGTWTETFSGMEKIVERADKLMANKVKSLPAELKAENVYLEEDELTLCTKATDGLKTTETIHADADLDSETAKITFTSSNAGVAKVDPKTGVVTAVKAGTANITAALPDGAKAVCVVTVKGIPSKITLKKKSVKLKVKDEYQITANIPKGTVCSTFKYKSSKPKVAKVSKTGLVTAKKKGTAKITVTAGNNSKAKATFTVKVKK